MSPAHYHSLYYAAIVCPGQVNEKIRLFKNRMKTQFGCTAALKSPAHITLVPPFWLDIEKEDELTETLMSFHSANYGFEIRLEGFGHFGKRVLFVAVKENPQLNLLKAEAETHFRASFAGIIKTEDRPFRPHVTIASRDMLLTHFEKAWEHFSALSYREVFTANAVSLLKLKEGEWKVIAEKRW